MQHEMLEQRIALTQHFIVGNQVVKISPVVLRDDAVHELSALLAAFRDKYVVNRCYHHNRQQTYMISNKITFAERKIMDGIEQVCFARTVCSHKTIHTFIKNEFRF